MTGNQTASLTPLAGFIIERGPGKGYHITSADGPYAEDFKSRALTLLDAIGQPDPKGPKEYYRLVGPITRSGEYVGVSVNIMPNGEARFRQSWFRIPKLSTNSWRTIVLRLLVSLVLFTAGAFAGRRLSGLDPSQPTLPTPGRTDASPPDKTVPPVDGFPPDNRMMKLINEFAYSSNVRSELKKYLSQEGLAADLSKAVVDEKRSVKLIADLDRSPPAQESIRLSNVEVAKLIRLLEVIDEFAAPPNP